MAYHCVDLIDDDGRQVARCDCGWASPPCPDASTAAGFYGDHRAAIVRKEKNDGE